MFGSIKEYRIRIASGGIKECVLRFPTNAELCERARKQRALRFNLGRGKSKYDPGNVLKVDGEFFAKIRIDKDGQPFTDTESAKALSKIEDARVEDVQRDGDAYRVEMAVPGGHVAHTLRIPLQDDVVEYGRSASPPSIDTSRSSEIRVRLEPALKLWEKIKVDVSGYASDVEVPVIHMDAAIVAVLNQVEADLEEPDPEE